MLSCSTYTRTTLGAMTTSLCRECTPWLFPRHRRHLLTVRRSVPAAAATKFVCGTCVGTCSVRAEWACSACTFVNSAGTSRCDVCGTGYVRETPSRVACRLIFGASLNCSWHCHDACHDLIAVVVLCPHRHAGVCPTLLLVFPVSGIQPSAMPLMGRVRCPFPSLLHLAPRSLRRAVRRSPPRLWVYRRRPYIPVRRGRHPHRCRRRQRRRRTASSSRCHTATAGACRRRLRGSLTVHPTRRRPRYRPHPRRRHTPPPTSCRSRAARRRDDMRRCAVALSRCECSLTATPHVK